MAERYNRFNIDESIKTELDVNKILTQEFNVENLGYSVVEIDEFLDKVARDYNKYEALLTRCVEMLNDLDQKNYELKLKNDELSIKLENNTPREAINTSSLSQVDILRRIARLEQEIFNKK